MKTIYWMFWAAGLATLVVGQLPETRAAVLAALIVGQLVTIALIIRKGVKDYIADRRQAKRVKETIEEYKAVINLTPENRLLSITPSLN